MDRRLAAILHADVVGYSRLMGDDEEGTLRALKDHLGALRVAIEGCGGRIVNIAGDAVLAEFGSVVAAVDCAVAAQRDLAARNETLAADRKLQFRIGVNLGEIVIDGDEIYGNGVNVAARLETLAEPGGICISGRVLEQVEDKIDVGFAYLGEHTVKNIKTPVKAFAVTLDAAEAGKVVGVRARGPVWPWLLLALGIWALVAGGGFLWWRFW
jgi:adenylate cyclase